MVEGNSNHHGSLGDCAFAGCNCEAAPETKMAAGVAGWGCFRRLVFFLAPSAF